MDPSGLQKISVLFLLSFTASTKRMLIIWRTIEQKLLPKTFIPNINIFPYIPCYIKAIPAEITQIKTTYAFQNKISSCIEMIAILREALV